MTTPAMTAQEALAPLIEAANRLAYVDFHTTPPTIKAPYPTFVADLRRVLPLALSALSDAERRATEAEKERDFFKKRSDGRGEAEAALLHRLSAVEARCGLMREALEPFAKITVCVGHPDWMDYVQVSVSQADLARARSILTYPGGKSDQGEKENNPGASSNADDESVRSADHAALGRTGSATLPTGANPPAGGEGKPEPVKATGEMIEAAASILYSEGGDYADDGMRGALLLAEKTINAALALAPLSRSGDSALVEARRLLKGVYYAFSWDDYPELSGDITSWLAEHPEVQQHGERK